MYKNIDRTEMSEQGNVKYLVTYSVVRKVLPFGSDTDPDQNGGVGDAF